MFLFTSLLLLLLSPLSSSTLMALILTSTGRVTCWDTILPLIPWLPALSSPSHPLQGSLLAFFTCSASSELPSSGSLDPLTEGADAHLPVPRSLDGVLSTSWFRGHEAQPEAMIFSPEGLPGPGHTGRETLDTQGSLVVRNVTTQDAGSYTVVLESSRGRRSVMAQIQVHGERGPMAGGTRFSVSSAHRDPFCHQSSLTNHPRT